MIDKEIHDEEQAMMQRKAEAAARKKAETYPKGM